VPNATPPREGLRGVRVRITARDIALGQRRDCGSCPVALALVRHLADGYYAQVGNVEVDIFASCGGHKRLVDVIRLPDKAVKFIAGFDRGAELLAKPFAFNLPLPIEALRRKVGHKGT